MQNEMNIIARKWAQKGISRLVSLGVIEPVTGKSGLVEPKRPWRARRLGLCLIGFIEISVLRCNSLALRLCLICGARR